MEDKSKRRARLILILGVLLALMAFAGTYFFASSKPEAAPEIPQSDVLVAARDIAPKTAVAPADLRLIKVNTDAVPAAALKDPKDVVGKIAIIAIGTGEFILPAKFASATAAAFTVFPPNEQPTAGQPIPPNSPAYRAMSISVPDGNAVGGAVTVGDVIDMLYTVNFDIAKLTGTSTTRVTDQSVKIALERIPIIAKLANVYTIRVDAATAERIQYLQASGAQLSFLLRAPQDDRAAQTTGATFNTVQQQYQFKVPEKVTVP